MIQALDEGNLRSGPQIHLDPIAKKQSGYESRDLAARHRRETRALKNNSRPKQPRVDARHLKV